MQIGVSEGKIKYDAGRVIPPCGSEGVQIGARSAKIKVGLMPGEITDICIVLLRGEWVHKYTW